MDNNKEIDLQTRISMLSRMAEHNKTARGAHEAGAGEFAIEECTRCGTLVTEYIQANLPFSDLVKTVDDAGSGTVIVCGQKTSLGEVHCRNIKQIANMLCTLYELQLEYQNANNNPSRSV